MKHLAVLGFGLGLMIAGPTLAQDHPGPMASPDAAGNPAIKDPHAMASDAPAKGHNSFTMGQARTRIEKAGYTQVMGLKKDHDGVWQGRARQDGRKVHVAMDFQGNVTSK
jgi:hypothetical protein